MLGLPFRDGLSRNDRDNVIEQYLSGRREEDVVADWRRYFTAKPEEMDEDAKRAWISSMHDISLASDAFFPFRDNIDRAAASGVGFSGVGFISEPGGSLRDDEVIRAADEHGMTMAFTGVRLFHH